MGAAQIIEIRHGLARIYKIAAAQFLVVYDAKTIYEFARGG
jgi:hypothetical protein